MLDTSARVQQLPTAISIKRTDQITHVTLPPKHSWLRRMWKHPILMHYHRLFLIMVLTNLSVFGSAIVQQPWWAGGSLNLDSLSNLVLINFSIAILIRQQYVINLLFWLATRAPTRWPLAIRRVLAKVYHFGGLHSGGAVCGTLWLFLLAAAISRQLGQDTSRISLGTAVATYLLLVVLGVILVMALPQVRSRFHNYFELSHRLGGWTALLLFWSHSIMLVSDLNINQDLSQALLANPSIWMLALLTFSILLPWLRLRKVPVRTERPSPHVVLARFTHGVTPFAGSSTAISRSPLTEWHSFANVPAPGQQGFRLTISRAGDWTGSFIDDLPSHVWVKGITTAGVGNVDMLFRRVIWVATGSGIGPCLPHLLAQQVPSLLVWSTKSPRKTYGDALVDEILAVQEHAVIWDTDAHGKPDMIELAYQAYQSFAAEAVICIANRKLTWQVVYGMESRGIPAYGAIWDS